MLIYLKSVQRKNKTEQSGRNKKDVEWQHTEYVRAQRTLCDRGQIIK